MTAVAFVVLAMSGTIVRAATVRRFNRPLLPLGTLAVNVAGAFTLGLLTAASSSVATAVGAGGLGSLTTFSTVAQELAVMTRLGSPVRAVVYAVVTLVAGVSAALVGMELA